ncbi:MAG: DUF2748 family protein [Alphaproteobacteria bacterium]|nr:DUF2748 family protein [Alphaproteobacteria bacterium]
MSHSLYDVTYKRYRLEKKLKPAEEALAKALVASGKMRLDGDDEANFVRLLLPQERVNFTFTLRELNDANLRKESQKRLLDALLLRHDETIARERLIEYMHKVDGDMKKRHPVSAKTELMMARAFVLCNALPVIHLIHKEGAEIYISFGHSVGDMMDIARWQEVGRNSGMQAVGGGENAIYVSCGGDPFLEPGEYRHAGDGTAALARFMIIAAQETGHNGDMIRNSQGQWVGRYSATNWDKAPSAKSGPARRADIHKTQATYDYCLRYGVRRIARWEENLQFFREKKLKNMRRFGAWLLARAAWQVFKLLLKKGGHGALCKLQKSPYPCVQLRAFFLDMLANLTPVADVYKRGTTQEQEAIACIEATARVPQQVIKWGHTAVRHCTPGLYALYYGEIVPACEQALKRSKN